MGSEDFLRFSTFEGLADIICAQDQELRQAKTHLAATTERHREEVTAMSAAHAERLTSVQLGYAARERNATAVAKALQEDLRDP